MPIIQQTIKEVFNRQELQRTLNSQETIARGCALQAAMLSPNFHVASFEIEEFNEHPINIQYKFHATEKVSAKELFKHGSSFPSTKTITFENKLGGVDLLVNYSDQANTLQGLPKQIAQYTIPDGKLDDQKPVEKFSFIMRVSNNIHNIAELDEAELVQEWTEEQKIPIKTGANPTPPKPEEKKDEKKEEGNQETEEKKEPEATAPAPEQQYEIKKKSKKNFSKIKFQTSNFALAPSMRK